MSILVIENYGDSPLGLVAEEFDKAGAQYKVLRPYDGDALPADAGDYVGLVVLGGAQSALADDEFAYLPALAALTRRFSAADRAVLGICLGAQIIARGHGAENILGQPVEFGFHPVRPVGPGARDPLIAALGDGSHVFHWHTDTFSLPQDAVHLAASAMANHQAFRIGRATYGIQFHFEVNDEIIDSWFEIAGHWLDEDMPGWRDALVAQRAAHARQAERIGRDMTRAWLGLV